MHSDHFYRDLAIAFCCALEMLAEEYEDGEDAPRIVSNSLREAQAFLTSPESLDYRILKGLQLESLHKEHLKQCS